MFFTFLQKLLITVSAFFIFSSANAQSLIRMDGTTGVGTGAKQNFSNITGANQTITINGDGVNANGTVNGSNLFFSFSQFSITAGDTARFQCPNGCFAVNNIIARVTGSSPSNFNGTLTSTIGGDVPTNFWFFNPNGVVLGANSVINIGFSGSRTFHNGNKADKVIFDNGAVFGLTTNPNASSLTAPPNSSFGFSPIPIAFGFPVRTPVTPPVATAAPVTPATPVTPPVIISHPEPPKLAISEQGIITVTSTLVEPVVTVIMPQLPEKLRPCISHNQSSLIAKGVANYLPTVNLQAPYSVLGTNKISLASAEQTQALTLDDSDECL